MTIVDPRFDPRFDALHGPVLFRSSADGLPHSVVLGEFALYADDADATTLADAILRAAAVSHLKAANALRDGTRR